ncbi:MAG: hypothetical protein V2I67_06000 [Thermoanaerobaculales bacterium]|jgi:hypothetical protein|nr:hypothetical protein [Thermoanaerobaculales bacterium]
MAKRKPTKRPSGKGNTSGPLKGQRGSNYSAGELFMAGCGALLLVLMVGIVITSILGD